MARGDGETEEERYWYRFGEGVRLLLTIIAAGVGLVFFLLALRVFTYPWLSQLFEGVRP